MAIVGALPRYGTCTVRTAPTLSNNSPARCPELPVLGEAWARFPGRARVSATSAAVSANDSAGFTQQRQYGKVGDRCNGAFEILARLWPTGGVADDVGQGALQSWSRFCVVGGAP